MVYYAITCRLGRWEYVCAGQDPQEVYQQGLAAIERQDVTWDDERAIVSPAGERQYANLRVVTAEAAQTVYRVTASRTLLEE